MGRPAIEMIGKTYGEWKVLERVPIPEGKSTHSAWYKCQCSCGVERIINGSELRRGKTTSCGHARYLKHKIGDIIGDYELLELWPNEKGIGTWKCKCGQETIIKEVRLAHKNDTSCSCQEKIKIDDTFYALTILKVLPHKPYEKQFYEVKCSCGKIFSARRDHLLRGETKSCGCGAANLTRADRVITCGKHSLSFGEETIKNLLEKYRVHYIHQYRNQEMRFSESQRTMPFDFAILNKNNEIAFLLEYDGEQHFQEVDIWEGRDNLAVRQKRDQEKEEVAQKKHFYLYQLNITYQLLALPKGFYILHEVFYLWQLKF